jgi:hypothetical protein
MELPLAVPSNAISPHNPHILPLPVDGQPRDKFNNLLVEKFPLGAAGGF